MSDKDLRVWVEDQLYALLGKLLPLHLIVLPWHLPSCSLRHLSGSIKLSFAVAGFAERALVDYCISLGKRAGSAASLTSSLEGQVCSAS